MTWHKNAFMIVQFFSILICVKPIFITLEKWTLLMTTIFHQFPWPAKFCSHEAQWHREIFRYKFLTLAALEWIQIFCRMFIHEIFRFHAASALIQTGGFKRDSLKESLSCGIENQSCVFVEIFQKKSCPVSRFFLETSTSKFRKRMSGNTIGSAIEIVSKSNKAATIILRSTNSFSCFSRFH